MLLANLVVLNLRNSLTCLKKNLNRRQLPLNFSGVETLGRSITSLGASFAKANVDLVFDLLSLAIIKVVDSQVGISRDGAQSVTVRL